MVTTANNIILQNINKSNTNDIDEVQMMKIMGLAKELCSVRIVFIYYKTENVDRLITTNDSSSKACDDFHVLYKQVFTKGVEIKKDDLDQKLSFFMGLPVKSSNNEVIASFCLINDAKIELNRFQTETLIAYVNNLSICLAPDANNLSAKNNEVSRIQEELKAISKFPGENPNPILRFDLDLNLVYHNQSAEASFLNDFGVSDGKIEKEEVQQVMRKIIENKEPNKQFYLEGDKHYYSINAALIKDMGYLNIYAHDITEYQHRNNENESVFRQLNEKLESQREFYEFILNNLPADVAVFNKNHQYVFINPKGIKDDEVREYMIGKDDYDYCKLKGISTEMADGRRARFKEILAKKENIVWVDDLIDSDGNRNVINRTMGPLFDENGDIRLVIGYGTDITQRVLAEEENVRLSLVAKNTNNGVLMLNKEMRITWANQAMIDRSGYSLPEMLGKNPQQFISSDDNSSEMSQIKEAAKLKKNIEVEVMQRSKEGKNYFVSLNLQPLFDLQGNHSGYMIVEFDITDRIKSEKTIQNLNVNLERLVQEKTAKNMELASSLRDQEKMVSIGELASGVAHDLNTPLGAIKSGTHNLSYTLDVLFQKVLPQCTSDEIQYAFSRTTKVAFELFVGGVQMKREKEQFLKLIDELDVNINKSELDEIAMLLVQNRIDISETKELLFILNSRDPKLLLTLMYHVHLVFSFIRTIANSGQRATEVIQNLRLFIREKRTAESGMVNIKNNIETVLNIFSHKIQNQVDLTMDIDSNIQIKGFDIRLFQLWSNLIKNALECMEDQNKKVLKIYSSLGDSKFTITVENNGPEIKGELKRKIFNKFFTTKGKRNGSGMGLSIVKNVLEEHQGKIELQSDAASTKFIIQFKR